MGRKSLQSLVALSLCAVGLALPAAASAGWGAPEAVEANINEVLLPPGGPGFVLGFAGGSPTRLRFAQRPLTGKLGTPQELPAEIGRHTLPAIGFDTAGDAVMVDEEPGLVGWRSANGDEPTPQHLEGHLLARWPRLVSVAPSGDALIGVNELRPGGSPVQLAFRATGEASQVDTSNTVDLTERGDLLGLQLQANGGAIAVYVDDVTGKLMQVVRRSGQSKFDNPVEIPPPPGTKSVAEISFSSDPSGWAMLSSFGRSTEGGPFDQVLGSVREPDGTFPTPTVIGSASSAVSDTASVTAGGDGMVTWREGGLGNPLCPAFGIVGVSQHLGVWGTQAAVGPDSWPDESLPATANTSFSSGENVAVPMFRVHEEGSPCPTPPATQTRSLIVHHFHAGPSGLTDQGYTELTPLSATGPLELEGFPMEPAGKILAWYRVGEARFLRSFDGVTPGPESTLGLGTGGGAPPGGGGGNSTTTTVPTTPNPTPKTTTPPPTIQPLKLQQFAIVPTITHADLEFEMRCPPVGEESCQGKAYFYYLLTGKQIKPARTFSASKGNLALVATGQVNIKPGAKGKVKMKPNALGKSLLRKGKQLKITLKLAISEGAQSFSGITPVTIKASKRTSK